MLHILSLICGLAAWCLPFFAACRYLAGSKPVISAYGQYSWFFCSAALLSQLAELRRLVEKGDFSAVDDTIGAVLIAATVLVLVNLVLNFAAKKLERK